MFTPAGLASAATLRMLPIPDAGSIRTLALLSILMGEGYHVAFVPLGNATEPHAHPHPRYSARLRAMGVHVFPRSTPAGWVEREQLLTVAGF